jgi:hypothetical protein
MTRLKIGPWGERKPTGRTVKLWVDSVSSATLPLLAGFSTTSVVVVADDAQNFRWSGLTVLFLAVAAVVLIAAVQFSYHARIALFEWCEREDEEERKKVLSTPSQDIRRQDADYRRGVFWAKRTRVAYDVGLLALLLGLGLAVAPYHVTGGEASARWWAASIAFLACAAEFLWTVVDPLVRSA